MTPINPVSSTAAAAAGSSVAQNVAQADKAAQAKRLAARKTGRGKNAFVPQVQNAEETPAVGDRPADGKRRDRPPKKKPDDSPKLDVTG